MQEPEDNDDGAMQELVTRLMAGDLPEGEFHELEQRLLHEPEVRERYFRHVWLEHALGTVFVGSSERKSRWFTVMDGGVKRPLAILAAAAVVMLSAWYWFRSPESAATARLIVCENSQWTVDGMMKPGASALSSGSDFRLLQGVAELEMPHGVTAIVEAPARLALVDGRTMKFDYGRAFFKVGRSGRGFTVVTPQQRIVDLGTEFGIEYAENETQAKLRVFKGQVRSDPPAGGGEGEVVKEGRSVLLEGSRVAGELAADASRFRQTLPAAVGTLLEDDFEYGLKDNEVVNLADLTGWERKGAVGYFNPSGSGRWYKHDGVNDDGPSKGEIGGMKGPNLGFFFSDTKGSMIRRRLGAIAPDSRYTVSVAIGVRDKFPDLREVFDGYTIRLMSGTTTLARISSNSPPGPFNSVTPVSFAWDSSVMPSGVKSGDPLTLEIAPNGASGSPYGYLDFDDVRVSVLGRP